MSISAETARIQYTLTSTGQTLAVPFYFLASADLKVVKTDPDTDIDTTLTLTTNYSVANAGNPAGGSVTLEVAAGAIGDIITIYRNDALTQPASYPSTGQFPSATTEQSQDRLTMLIQQIKLELARTVRIPVSNAETSPLTKTARASTVLTFDDNGDIALVSIDGDLTGASNNLVTASNSLTARTLAERFAEKVNVRDFGAVGDGSTDDTAAIEAAWTFAKARTSPPYNNGLVPYYINSVANRALYFPPGDYVYAGTGLEHDGALDSLNINIVAEPGTARIRIPDGVTFLTAVSQVFEVNIFGIESFGGDGFFWSTYTSVDVGRHKRVERCGFYDYSVAAIGHLSSDSPYWKIRENIFYGRAGESCIGVVLGGLCDQSGFEDNSFLANKYHVKMDGTPNCLFKNNDFLRFTTTSPIGVADVWLVPRANTDPTNNGDNILFVSNKFGNENLKSGDFRILIADETTGTNRIDKQHATTSSTGTINNVKFSDNNIVGNDTWGLVSNSCFVKSYCPAIEGFQFDDAWQGTLPEYVIHHAYDPTEKPLNSRTVLFLGRTEYAGINLPPKLCNYANQGWVIDRTGAHKGDVSIPDYWGGQDNATLWLRDSGAVADSLSSVTESSITDSLGNASNARELTFSGATGTAIYNLAVATVVGRVGWIELDVKAGSSLALASIRVYLGYSSTNYTSYVVRVPSSWTTIVLPFTIGTAVTAAVVIGTDGYAAGVTTKVQVGRLRVYHAQSPQPASVPRLNSLVLDDGITAPSTITGKATIYIDSADGDLKIKYGDGTVKVIVADT